MCTKPTKEYIAKEDFDFDGFPIKKGMIIKLNEYHIKKINKDKIELK